MKNKLYIPAALAIILLFGCNPENGLGVNDKASITGLGDLPENPLLLSTITTSFYPKDSLITVLYGNSLAYKYATKSADGNYPISAVLYSVTWQFQEDGQWFGANVPKNIRMIERIEFSEGNKTIYTYFDGNGVQHTNSDNAPKRINHIKEMKMAVSP